MNIINKKSIVSAVITASFMLGSLPMATLAVSPTWDTTGNYVINMNYLGTDYAHDMSLTQDNTGMLTGNGGSPAGANVYTWVITSGSVSGNAVDFYANYTATADAVTPQTTMHVMGTVALNGSMSGTWSDNYQGGARSGTWMTVSGTADPIPPPPVITTPTNKDECKNDGWKTFTAPSFKNQGQCVAYTNHN